jgi:hypothetical protein
MVGENVQIRFEALGDKCNELVIKERIGQNS